jgi:hypothetical protein
MRQLQTKSQRRKNTESKREITGAVNGSYGTEENKQVAAANSRTPAPSDANGFLSSQQAKWEQN